MSGPASIQLPAYFISDPSTDGEMTSGLRAASITLPIFSIFALIILIVPLKTHLRVKSVGFCAVILYVQLMNLMTFINAIIWTNQDYDSWWIGYGLCDVEIKIKAIVGTGAPCAILCITRGLARVFDPDSRVVHETKAIIIRRRLMDLGICFGLPLVQIGLHYITQINRYYLEPVGGCVTSYDNSWPTILIFFVWPPLFSLINCYYAILIIHGLQKHRHDLSQHLSNSTSNTDSASRYLRMFFMSFSLITIYTPASIYFFCYNVNISWLSYDWSIIHDPEQWNIILYLPFASKNMADKAVAVVMAVFMAIFFAFTRESRNEYQRAALAIGLGRLFPYLRTRGRKDSSKRGLLARFSLVQHARAYFGKRRNNSTATSVGMLDATFTNTSSMRKDSLAPSTSHHDPSQLHPSNYLPDLLPVSSNLATEAPNQSHHHSSPEPVHISTSLVRAGRANLSFPSMSNLFSKPSSYKFDSTPSATSANKASTSNTVNAERRSGMAENIVFDMPSGSATKADLETRVWGGKGTESEEVASENVLTEVMSREDSIKVKTRVERREDDA